MKIIHIISTLSKGGAERVMVELGNEAAVKGHQVLLVVGWKNNPEYLQSQVRPDVSIEFISNHERFAYLKLFFWLITKRKKVKSYDVFHCHLTYGAVAGALVHLIYRNILGFSKPAIIETNHAVGMAVSPRKRWLHSNLLKFRDGIVMMANDNFWNKFIASHSNILFRLIKNGTSVSLLPQTQADKQNFKQQHFQKLQPKYIVGTVGMLRPDRQPWLYIPIFKSIYRELGNDVAFILAGDGSEKEKIVCIIADAGIADRVHLPGLVNNPATIVSHMDMYVSLGVREVAGISMIEAAMCGVPVVGIQLDKDYRSTSEDWFWSDSNTEKVAQRIIWLLKNEYERKSLAQLQFDFVNTHFNSTAMADSYQHFYEEVIGKNI